MADGKVAGDRTGIGAPLRGQRFVAPAAVLLGEAAERRVAGVEGLALGLGGDDQAMGQRAGDEAALQLGGEDAPGATGPVLPDVVEIILVGRAEKSPRNLPAPSPRPRGPDPALGLP